MRVVGMSIDKKTFLLPVVLTVAFFLVAFGMRPPQLHKISKPRVHHRDVVQNQDKVSQSGIEKSSQVFEPCPRVELIEPPSSYRVSACYLEERSSSLNTESFIPSRAPPASLI
jgi:hypothetical protein